MTYAGVAELADARDLKSRETHLSYRFDPGRRHWYEIRKSLLNKGFRIFFKNLGQMEN